MFIVLCCYWKSVHPSGISRMWSPEKKCSNLIFFILLILRVQHLLSQLCASVTLIINLEFKFSAGELYYSPKGNLVCSEHQKHNK